MIAVVPPAVGCPYLRSLISPAYNVRTAYCAQSLGVPYNNSFIYPNVTGYSFSFTSDGYFEQTQCASVCHVGEGLAREYNALTRYPHLQSLGTQTLRE